MKITHKLPQRYTRLLIAVFAVAAFSGLLAVGVPVSTTADSSACQSTAPYGTDTLPSQFVAPNVLFNPSTTYSIWVRMKTSSSSSNSVGLEVGTTCYNVGGVSLTPNTWQWVNYDNGSTSSLMTQLLDASTYVPLELFGNQSGVSIDQVELLVDNTCIPSGDSGNCTVNQPPSLPPPTVISTGGGTGTTAPPTADFSSWVSPQASTSNPVPTISGVTTLSVLVDNPDSTTQINFGQGNASSPTPIGSTTSETNGIYSINWDSTTVPNGTTYVCANLVDSAVANALVVNTCMEVNISNSTTTTTPTSPTSPTASCNGPTMPPTNLTASVASANQVNLQWTAGSVGPNCEPGGYNLYRTGGAGPVVLYPAFTNTTFNDTTVSSSTAYSYQVTELDGSLNGHESAKSNTASVTTPASQTCQTGGQIPGTPTLSATSVSYNTIALKWTQSKVTAPNCQLAGYNVYRNGTLLTKAGTSPSSTTYTDSGLSSGTAYNYTIVAYDNGGNDSAKGGPYSFTTETDNVAPTQPSGFSARVTGSTSVSLAWGASYDLPNPGGVGLAGYRIYRNGGSNPIAALGSTAVSYNDSGLSPATAYTYTIVAYDNNNNTSVPVSLTNSPVTTQAAASTTCSANPGTPTQLTTTALGLTSVSFSWHASTAAANCTLNGYNVSRSGGNTQLVTSGTNFNDTGLTPNTSYTYTVTAVDKSGHTSINNPSITLKTTADTTAPSAPTNVIDSVLGPTSVQLTWNASTDNVGVTGYNIYRNGSTTPYKTVGNVTTYLDTGAIAGTTYTYQVSAFDAAGNVSGETNAQPSPITTAKTTDTQAPSTPGGLKAALTSSSSVSLTWTPSTDNVGVTGYDVYRNGNMIGSSSIASYIDNNLAPQTSYSYSIKAYDAAGNLSVASSTLSVTTLAGTSTPPSRLCSLFCFLNSYFTLGSVSGLSVANNANIDVAAPTVITPAVVQDQGVKNVTYYLNNKVVATETAAPYAYNLDPATMLNGNYKLVSKTLYTTGASRSITQNLALSSPMSFAQARLFIEHNLLVVILVMLILAVALVYASTYIHLVSEMQKPDAEA